MSRDLTTGPADKRAELEAYLDNLATTPSRAAGGAVGRLVFALDATASRQPTWDQACSIQAQMFQEAGGDLGMQLVYFGGHHCRASGWITNAGRLGDMMASVQCVTGTTQIGRVLGHAAKENRRAPISALVFVGDAMEEEPGALYEKARTLDHVPAFMFQEGDEPVPEKVFREIAKITGGAFCRFTPGSAKELGDLLRAVAAYAAGGVEALEAKGVSRLLIGQLKR